MGIPATYQTTNDDDDDYLEITGDARHTAGKSSKRKIKASKKNTMRK